MEKRKVIRKIREFIRKELVLTIAFVCAVVTILFVPVSEQYISYINFHVLGLLFSLMVVVEGFREVHLFEWISKRLLSMTNNGKVVMVILVMLCFFLSMFVTNDVVLIAFVPLTVEVFGERRFEQKKAFTITVVLETIAANLGSMVTPIGNPQNIFLYAHYNLDLWTFFQWILPYSGISLVLLLLLITMVPAFSMEQKKRQRTEKLPAADIIIFSILFLVCLGVVAKKVSMLLCFLIVVLTVLIFRRNILKKVDYMLLLTFVCFFVFSGNLSNIDIIKTILSTVLEKHTFLTGVLSSQFISNVPSAIMLAPFTNDAKELLLGVNVGGLGTLVASLASLISYRFYAEAMGIKKGRYLLYFSAYNILFLVILIGVHSLFGFIG